MAKKRHRVKQNIPKDETKAARFVRVVTPRIDKAGKAISVIGFCAGSSYDYTDEQVNQIIERLRDALDALTAKFAKKADSQESFSFKE